MGKRPAIFPYKRGGTADTTPSHSFLCEGFSMCLSKRSALRHIDPKAQTERWDILDRLSKRRYDSLEKEF